MSVEKSGSDENNGITYFMDSAFVGSSLCGNVVVRLTSAVVIAFGSNVTLAFSTSPAFISSSIVVFGVAVSDDNGAAVSSETLS